MAFADHHWYSAEDLARLDGGRARSGADALVTTEKDWVRLRRLRRPRGLPVFVVSVAAVGCSTGAREWRTRFERACPCR